MRYGLRTITSTGIVVTIACLLMLFAGRANAQTPQASQQITGFAWLTGCWEAQRPGGRVVSEQWTKPAGNAMTGMSHTVRSGKMTEFEFVRLYADSGGSVMYEAHPSGQSGATFRLVSLEKSRAVFENPGHDFPQRIIYHRVSDDSLVARIEGTVKGKERHADFPYRKVRCE